MSLERYKTLKKNNLNKFEYPSVKAHAPIVDEQDLERGYIVRCFVQKSNDSESPIIEVNQKAVSFYQTNSFYTVVQLKWKITGKRDEIRQANSKSIKLASDVLPTLHLYLPNFLQFSKPD